MILNLFERLRKKEEEDDPISIGIIGAGKFTTMFLSQARITKGFRIKALADTNYRNAKKAVKNAGYSDQEEIFVTRFGDTDNNTDKIWYTDDGIKLAKTEELDVIVEATGDPEAAIVHSLTAFKSKSHVILATVEADALCGSMLTENATSNDVICSMAYGDQPALICELVDQLRSSGFKITCAGKGTKYLPEYHNSTPATALKLHGFNDNDAILGGLNPKLFNSFIDGTKSSIPDDGLNFFPSGNSKLVEILRPKKDGGLINNSGTVDVVSSLERDGTEIDDHLRFGIFVVFETESNYVSRCFKEYGMATDLTGKYSCLWRPYHLIGLELGYSIARAVLDNKATGYSKYFIGDTVAVTKKNLNKGDMLDGDGGECAWGKLIPSNKSIGLQALPIGLTNNLKLNKNLSKGSIIKQEDVFAIPNSKAYELRKKMIAKNKLKPF